MKIVAANRIGAAQSKQNYGLRIERSRVCPSVLQEVACVYGRGGAVTGAGLWRKYRDFYAAGSDSASPVTREESGRIGAPYDERVSLRRQLGRKCTFVPHVSRLQGEQQSVHRDVLPVSLPSESGLQRPVMGELVSGT